MGNIIIQQFNPKSKCWNTIHEINENEYDENEFVPINKYDGPYRVLGQKKVLDFYGINMVEEIELEDEPEFDEVEEDEFRENEVLNEDRW